jgi:polysaccharide pyruvyl transferase WcaK-like protein
MNNYGDEMLLRSILKLLKEVGIEEIDLLYPRKGSRKIGGIRINHVLRSSPLALFNSIRNADILIGGGGNIFQDETSNRSFFYYKNLMSTALFFKKPVLLMGHGIGKINQKKHFKQLRKILSDELCTGYFRDDISYRYARSCSGDHKRGTDLGYLFLRKRQASKKVPSRIGVFLKRPWENAEDFVRAFKGEGIEEIQFFVAFPDQDLKLSKEAAARFGAHFETSVKVGEVNDITDQASTCSMIISERLHGSIIASFFSIPFITADTFKMRSYFSDIKGYEAYFKDKSLSEIVFAISKLREINFEEANQKFIDRNFARLKAMKKWLKIQILKRPFKQ